MFVLVLIVWRRRHGHDQDHGTITMILSALLPCAGAYDDRTSCSKTGVRCDGDFDTSSWIRHVPNQCRHTHPG